MVFFHSLFSNDVNSQDYREFWVLKRSGPCLLHGFEVVLLPVVPIMLLLSGQQNNQQYLSHHSTNNGGREKQFSFFVFKSD